MHLPANPPTFDVDELARLREANRSLRAALRANDELLYLASQSLTADSMRRYLRDLIFAADCRRRLESDVIADVMVERIKKEAATPSLPNPSNLLKDIR